MVEPLQTAIAKQVRQTIAVRLQLGKVTVSPELAMTKAG